MLLYCTFSRNIEYEVSIGVLQEDALRSENYRSSIHEFVS